MTHHVTALFVDSRKELPNKFSQILWPAVQFNAFDRVGRLTDAVQKYVLADFELCFISDRVTDPLSDFFIDIARSRPDHKCIFIKILSSATAAARPLESGFQFAVSEEMLPEDRMAVANAIGAAWHKTEVDRRTDDIDSSISLLLRIIDNAASARRRGRDVLLDKGATSLMRMHTEFDESILDEFLERLSLRLDGSKPVLKLMKKIPMELLQRNLPALNENGYYGASARVYEMLVDRFGEEIGESQQERRAKAEE